MKTSKQVDVFIVIDVSIYLLLNHDRYKQHEFCDLKKKFVVRVSGDPDRTNGNEHFQSME